MTRLQRRLRRAWSGLRGPGAWARLRAAGRRTANSTTGRCVVLFATLFWVTLVPYALFPHWLFRFLLRGRRLVGRFEVGSVRPLGLVMGPIDIGKVDTVFEMARQLLIIADKNQCSKF